MSVKDVSNNFSSSRLKKNLRENKENPGERLKIEGMGKERSKAACSERTIGTLRCFRSVFHRSIFKKERSISVRPRCMVVRQGQTTIKIVLFYSFRSKMRESKGKVQVISVLLANIGKYKKILVSSHLHFSHTFCSVNQALRATCFLNNPRECHGP